MSSSRVVKILKSMDDLKATYNKIAESWDEDHARDTWWIEGTDRFISYLKPGASVLDVGCGAGTKSKYLIGKGLQVTGMDFAENMVELAQKKVPAGRFLAMDVNDLSGLQQSFDGILAQAVLLHISKRDVPKVLKELKDKLRPSGYLYVAVKEIRPGGKEEEVVTESDYGYEYSRFFSYFALDELKRYFQDAGMKILYENVVASGKTNWIQVIGQA